MTATHPHFRLRICGEQTVNDNGISWKAKLVLALLWLNFLAMWMRVYQITTASDVESSFTHLGSLIVVYALTITVWIFHNVRIFNQKGPRQSSRIVQPDPRSDTLGRSVSRRVDLKGEQYIVVDMLHETKVFMHASKPAEVEEESLTRLTR